MCPDAVLGQSWPEGTKVDAIRKTGDFYAGGRADSSSKVKDGRVTFKDLEAGPYWAAGEVDGANVVVSFTAKDVPAPKKPVPARQDPQRTPTASPSVEIVTGAKGTKVAGRITEVPAPKHDIPAPHQNQASIGGKEPQRSSTAVGQATPVDPKEVLPKPRQEDVPAKTPQASDTETGEAALIVEDSRQEDAGKKLAQRSDTETGTQEPVK